MSTASPASSSLATAAARAGARPASSGRASPRRSAICRSASGRSLTSGTTSPRSRAPTPGRAPSPSTRTRSREALTGILVLLPLAIHAVWGIGRMCDEPPEQRAVRLLREPQVPAPAPQRARRAALSRRAPLARARSGRASSRGTPRCSPTSRRRCTSTRRRWSSTCSGRSPSRTTWPTAPQTFCMGWGIVTSQRGLRRLEGATLAFFVLLLLMSWGAVYALWAAGAPARRRAPSESISTPVASSSTFADALPSSQAPSSHPRRRRRA